MSVDESLVQQDTYAQQQRKLQLVLLKETATHVGVQAERQVLIHIGYPIVNVT